MYEGNVCKCMEMYANGPTEAHRQSTEEKDSGTVRKMAMMVGKTG